MQFLQNENKKHFASVVSTFAKFGERLSDKNLLGSISKKCNNLYNKSCETFECVGGDSVINSKVWGIKLQFYLLERAHK